jgi:hypothetical protein
MHGVRIAGCVSESPGLQVACRDQPGSVTGASDFHGRTHTISHQQMKNQTAYPSSDESAGNRIPGPAGMGKGNLLANMVICFMLNPVIHKPRQ